MTCLIDPGDIAITRGNNYPPAMWQFLESEDPDVLFDLTGSVFELRVYWRGGSLTRATNANPELAIDYVNSLLTWNYAIADSRLLPLGRVARYELERWIGLTQQSVVTGFVSVGKGANPD